MTCQSRILHFCFFSGMNCVNIAMRSMRLSEANNFSWNTWRKHQHSWFHRKMHRVCFIKAMTFVSTCLTVETKQCLFSTSSSSKMCWYLFHLTVIYSLQICIFIFISFAKFNLKYYFIQRSELLSQVYSGYHSLL